MDRISDALIKLNAPEADRKDILDGFDTLINKGMMFPSELWECAGTGAFKECYLWNNVAVKFAAEDNYTMDTEDKAYQQIINSGIEQLFAKTFFIPSNWDFRSGFLSRDNYRETYNSNYHCYEEVENDSYEIFDCIVIQERIDKTFTDTPFKKNPIMPGRWIENIKRLEYYENNPLFDEFGNIICFEQAALLSNIFAFHKWTQDAIICYGLEFMNKAAKICNDLEIHDLHSANIGYRADGTPVIFDFLS